MLDQIQPKPLRIFIRWLLLTLGVIILTLFHVVVIVPLFSIASQFWVGWVSAFLYFILFPSTMIGSKE